MKRPIFCVGEEVGIESILMPHLKRAQTEIIKSKYFDGEIYLGLGRLQRVDI
jgi:hypothetical protein